MNAADYLESLAPEVCLIAGACMAWLVGVSKSPSTRSLLAPFSLLVLVASMVCLWDGAPSDTSARVAGLAFTELSQFVRWSTLIVGVLILFVSWRLPAEREQGEFFGLVLCSMAGVMLTASANDLVVLFFAIELVSIPTYVLVALSRTDRRASEAAVKYFFLGAMAAAVMVYGFSFLYGLCGSTLLTAEAGPSLAAYLSVPDAMGTYAVTGIVLAFAGLCFKIAAVPFHAYVADVYEGAASPITGLLGYLPKLAGFVAMIKLMAVCGGDLPRELTWMLWGVAAVTMTAGNVLALLQTNVKRMLAYSSIAHSGYMLIGLLVGPAWGEGPMHDGIAAILFYIVVYGVMNLGVFAVLSTLGVSSDDTDSPRAAETLDDLAGLSQRAPLAAFAMVVCAFSLMGFPPTAGFVGKIYLFSGAFSTGDYSLIVLAVIAVINSAIGAAYYLRIASACYVRDPSGDHSRTGGFMPRIALAVCALAMLVLFIRPGELVHHAQSATSDLPTAASSLVRADTYSQDAPVTRRRAPGSSRFPGR